MYVQMNDELHHGAEDKNISICERKIILFTFFNLGKEFYILKQQENK